MSNNSSLNKESNFSDYIVRTAKNFAFYVHRNQVDKAGRPYTEHLSAVADMCEYKSLMTVAYLHDVIEDTETPEELIEALFGDVIKDAIVAITKKKDESYEDYINRVSQNILARKVKMKDLLHNMRLDRLKEVTEKDIKRNKKYLDAYEYLLKVEKGEQ